MRRLLALMLGCLALLLAAPADAADKEELPAGVELPLRVRIGLRVLDITEAKEVAGRARLYVEVTQRWIDPRRQFDPLQAGAPRVDRVGDDATQFLTTIWTPGVVIDNQIGPPQSTTQAVSAYAAAVSCWWSVTRPTSGWRWTCRRFRSIASN
jgi:hypothetical protein